MIRNFTDDAEDITTERGEALALRLVLDHVRAKMVAFQEETGHLYNLEATPAEGTTYRFAREDKKRFPGILQAGTPDAPYYTNSSQLPVGFTDDAFEAPVGKSRSRPATPAVRCCISTWANACRRRRLARSWSGDRSRTSSALHHGDADVLDLPQARLHRRRA